MPWIVEHTDLDHALLGPFSHDENVGRLEISMQHPVGVEIVDSIERLPDERLDGELGQWTSDSIVMLYDTLRSSCWRSISIEYSLSRY